MIIARTTLVWKKVQVLLTWRGILLVVVPLVLVVIAYLGLEASITFGHDEPPRQILLDTDVDTDDVFALFYLLKQNPKEFNLKAITVNANSWSDAGHAINHVYDILFMMGRDDIPVGVGGEGGILPNGTILPNVGGYLPIIDQGTSTAGGCRYRQAIPPGLRGFINSNYGLRKGFLPQGDRQYNPIQQPTAQKVMTDAISAGPITVFLTGAHTNFAIFLMNNPHLKKNVEHIYVMGGAIRSNCLTNANSSTPETCRPIGNLYPPDINPYAEFNIFSDPLASYMVFHSGVPVTLIPLDATKTIPVSRNFFSAFEKRQDTYEAQYCFQSLKKIRDTWNNDEFHQDYCMWDSFMVGVALSIMKNSQSRDGENEFSDMEYMNITVVTANEPYGIVDGSNPLTDGRAIAGLKLQKNMLHNGHVQMGMQDPFCLKNGRGGCQDGYTKEVNDSEAVRTLVATRAKSSHRIGNSLEREYYRSFLDVINQPEQSGRFSFITQFPYFQEVTYRPNFTGKAMGKTVVFDMDMSVGDFLALLYLLKLPPELINLKAILVSSTGWSTSATVDVLYDMLHMMGRDDIPVGLGDVFAVGQAYPTYPAIGDCKYAKAIPHGSGGFLDSDTLYGLARQLPRSPRRYTAESSAIYGAPQDTDHPELRQKSALDVWRSTVKSLEAGSSITILANAPLTNLAQIIQSENTSVIKEIYIVGGQIGNSIERGNLFTIPSNEYAEFNMFLDPLAAKTVLNSDLNITFIPLIMQRKVSSFSKMLKNFENKIHTAEATFAQNLLSRLWKLQKEHHRYQHMENFLGEILGAVTLGRNPYLNQTFTMKPLKIFADGDESKLGRLVIDNEEGKLVKVLENVNSDPYYHHFAELLSADNSRSAVIGSFQEQKKQWSTKPNIPT